MAVHTTKLLTPVSTGEPSIPPGHLAKLVTLGCVTETVKGAIVTGDGLTRMSGSE